MRKLLLVIIVVISLFVCAVSAYTPLSGYVYSNAIQFNVSTNAAVGTVTNFPIMINLTNETCVSSSTSICTNGTTLGNWYDIEFTNSSDAALSFWVENGTTTATNATAWVNIPSITTTGGDTTIRFYYGNATRTTSTMDGLNTFPFWDDFLGSTYNITQWAPYGTAGAITVSNGIMQINGSASAYYSMFANATSGFSYGGNYTMRAYWKVDSELARYIMGFDNGASTNQSEVAVDATNTKYFYTTKSAATTNTARTSTDTAYGITDINRNNTVSIIFVDHGVTAVVTANVPVSTAGMGPRLSTYSTTRAIYADWVLVRPFRHIAPGTSDYVALSSGSNATLTASFTDAPDPSNVGGSVQFNDTSTGNPTTWNWTFGDIGGSNTSALQNPTHTYTTAGNYTVLLNVSNSTGSFSEASDWHNVTNASAFTPQDVWMEGQYNVTVHVITSSGVPLAGATVSTSNGLSNTTNALGYAYITEPFGLYVFYTSLSGYATDSRSVIVDEDMTITVQLDEAPSVVDNPNVWYTPHQVRLSIVDTSNAKIVNAVVNATAIASTFPDDASSEWLEDLYGIQPDVANDMMNGTLIMEGITGGDGATVFTMHSSIMYNIQIENPATGIVHSTNITPIDEMYLITIAGAAAANNTYEDMGWNQTLWIYEPNSSYVTMNFSFQDMSGRTNLVIFYVNHLPNNTLLYSDSIASPGTSEVKMNYTVKNTRPNRYVYGYWANRTV